MRKRHPVRRFICGLFILLLCSVIARVRTHYGVKGYTMYRDTINQVSLEDRVEEIRGEEHFTSYAELPDFYINAVISVEDHRFRQHPGLDPIAI